MSNVRILLAMIASLALTGALHAANSIPELEREFANPPDDARIMMRWWWFGSAVTKTQIDKELRLMKAGGIGGFEVQPVYPVVLDDPSRGVRNLPFLSDEFLEMLRFTAEKAKEYGLRMDLTLGSGWPYGGPNVPVTQAAGRLRWQRVKVAPGARRVAVPSIGNGEQLLAAYEGGGKRELSGVRDGVLALPGDFQAGEVWFFISSRTGMMVKRPAVGAEGFVIDHYDRAALDGYLANVGERMMKAFGPAKPHAIFCDSLEVFGSDWTPALFAEFQKRRGYDLKPHLPALVTDMGPQTAAVRHDWGRTLTETLEERFLQPMQQWVNAKGARFRIQNYGIPPATLSSHRYADLPEGEGSQWKVVRAARWASSASHLYNREAASSETWTWLHSPSFRATPLDMKAEADIHFLQGVTQLIRHGWPYTPEGEAYPGWRFYASAVFNEKNPWWIVMPDVARYLQRVTHMLRQGRPANDVALYLPNADAWSGFRAGQVHMIESLREQVGPVVMPQILEAGYGLDFIDDGTLELAAGRYRIVVLPDVEYMPAATLRWLEEFARNGGSIVATRRLPSAAPGLRADQGEFRTIAARLADKVKLAAKDEELGAALRSVLPPDVRFSSPGLGFVHRAAEAGDIYFLVNTGNTPVREKAVFRMEGRAAEWWDPRTGAIHPASETNEVLLDLAPYESRILIFPSQPRKLARAAAAAAVPAEISGPWKIDIGGVAASALGSWTADERTRYFSGVAAYETAFDVTPAQASAAMKIDFGAGTPAPPPTGRRGGPGMRALLDGPVREAAVVYVNGKRAGSVWSAPYEADVTGLLRAGRNELRIEVANTAINHMAGRALPDYRLLNLRYGVRFEPQDMNLVEPVPSGLLGGVRLAPR